MALPPFLERLGRVRVPVVINELIVVNFGDLIGATVLFAEFVDYLLAFLFGETAWVCVVVHIPFCAIR